MSISLYDASAPVYVRMLRNLAAMLDKAEAHAQAGGIAPESILQARLAPDMHPLVRQVQMVSDGAKNGAARLAGVEIPSFPDTETTFAELQARLAKTVAFVESVPRELIDAAEDREIQLVFPGRILTFTGKTFLFDFSLPNILFHVVTAYGLMRAQGVALGKADFLAGALPDA